MITVINRRGLQMFTQLNPCIPVQVEGKGKGVAVAVIDYSQEHDLMWVVITDAAGEFWCVPNALLRAQANWSLGRILKPTVLAEPCSPISSTEPSCR